MGSKQFQYKQEFSVDKFHIYCTSSVKFDTKVLHVLLITLGLTCFVIIAAYKGLNIFGCIWKVI